MRTTLLEGITSFIHENMDDLTSAVFTFLWSGSFFIGFKLAQHYLLPRSFQGLIICILLGAINMALVMTLTAIISFNKKK